MRTRLHLMGLLLAAVANAQAIYHEQYEYEPHDTDRH